MVGWVLRLVGKAMLGGAMVADVHCWFSYSVVSWVKKVCPTTKTHDTTDTLKINVVVVSKHS